MRVPVLTYHSNNIHGNACADNDHVALAADLAELHALGWRVVPLQRVVESLLGTADASGLERCVALSFDDGSWFDWHELEHPTWGPQRSMARILREHRAATGASVHATSFVIVSPEARAVLDRTCMVGRGWWTDDWWCEAVQEGLLAIESHSWDHNHETLPATAQTDGRTGTFRSIDNWIVADAELRQASDWLDARCAGQRTRLLAYPYGEANDYLVREYLPRFGQQHRLQAAFTTEPAPLTAASDRWRLPRYVCGRDWQAPEGLRRILRDCAPVA
jgi:peptidoglycan/xylan/chitin deacetylase (PgdA/CDA1 family)